MVEGPDLRFRIPASLELYRERLLALFPRERRAIDRYVRCARAVMRAIRQVDRRDGRVTVMGALALLRDALHLRRIGDHTIGELLDSWTRDPRLKAIFLGQSGDYGVAPSRASGLLHLGMAAHYFCGAFYPKGGGQIIADKLAESVERAGGVILLRHPIEKIVIERGRATAVRVAPRAGEPAREVRAEIVLSNADLKRTLLELVGPEHLPSDWTRRVDRFEMAAALFMTFLGVKGDLRARGMTNTNYWQFDDYDVDEFYRAADAMNVRGCYITSATLKDPDNARHHAPEGISNLEVMTIIAGTGHKWGVSDADADAWRYDDDPRYQEHKRRIEDELVARFERLFPGPGEIVFRESATPVTHRRFTGATGGTGYGLAAIPEQFMKARPGYRGPIEGVYLCGASTRAGHGIVGARRAAMRVEQALSRSLHPPMAPLRGKSPPGPPLTCRGAALVLESPSSVSDLAYLNRLSPAEQRAAVALVEAVVPGSANIRPADENAVGKLLRVATDINPIAVPIIAKVVRALDLAAFAQTGKRFADLSTEAQQRLIQRWYMDPVMRAPLHAVAFSSKFMHFDGAHGYTRQRKLEVVTQLENHAYLQQIVRGDESPEDEIECEVVVVGTGAGGAVVGKELADRGAAVVFMEEGEHWRRDAVTGSAIDAHYKFYRGALVLGQSVFPVFSGKMVGGSTAINTGSSYRTPDYVLDEWCEELGTDAFSPANMREHFERVERTLPVEAPLRKHVGPIADVFERGAAKFGWKHGPVLRNAVGCEGQGFCDFGCPTDARRSTNLSYVPPALKKGALCLTGLRCDELIIENGRAVGVVGVTSKGRKIRVRAQAVVLAMGALLTPQFLLDRGLCNSSGQVGRNISLHPSAGFSALMDEPIMGRQHIPQGWHLSEFIKDGILISAAQTTEDFSGIMFPYYGRTLMNVLERLDHIAGFGVLIRDRRRQGRILRKLGDHVFLKYVLTPEDVALTHRGMVHVGELALAAGAKVLYPTMMSVNPIETKAQWDAFKRMTPSASQMMYVSYHPLGSCQIGRNPRTSVVGLDHQAHDLPGLYIVDGSTVPGPPSVNPQITIMAMATRAAAFIADAVTRTDKPTTREEPFSLSAQ